MNDGGWVEGSGRRYGRITLECFSVGTGFASVEEGPAAGFVGLGIIVNSCASTAKGYSELGLRCCAVCPFPMIMLQIAVSVPTQRSVALRGPRWIAILALRRDNAPSDKHLLTQIWLRGTEYLNLSSSSIRTQVGIVGAGPAGLVLSHLLHLNGIESVVVESRSRQYCEERVRAGLLEQGTVDLLVETGVGENLKREGMVHHGLKLRFNRETYRIDFNLN